MIQRVRQLIYNNVSSIDAEGRPTINPACYVSALSLFKKRFACEIIARRDTIRLKDGQRETLVAYNEAVRELFQKYKSEHEEDFATLEATVAQLKVAIRKSWEDQPEDVQKA